MKYHFLWGFALATFSIFNLKAQNAPTMLLSKYTFNGDAEKVATINMESAGSTSALTLSGPDASNFKIKDGNILCILDKARKKGKQHYSITISGNIRGEYHTHDFIIARDEFRKNEVIAHRGAWKNTGVPENSLAALNQAIVLGCAGSEFDVQLSADSILYINHDPQIQGITIEKADKAQLQAIKLSNGEHLPTLEEYIKTGMKQNRTKLILELKPSIISKERGLTLAGQVMDMVRRLHAEAWIDYISFDYNICLELRKLDPTARIFYLNGDKDPETLANDALNGFDYHISVLRKNPDWLKQAAALKLETNSWTVNKEEDMDWLLSQKINYITTNEPELLLRKIKQSR